MFFYFQYQAFCLIGKVIVNNHSRYTNRETDNGSNQCFRYSASQGIGLNKYVVKVVDGNLSYVCDLEFPREFVKRAGSIRSINFFEKGIYLVESDNEVDRYVECYIKNKNLKQIFK